MKKVSVGTGLVVLIGALTLLGGRRNPEAPGTAQGPAVPGTVINLGIGTAWDTLNPYDYFREEPPALIRGPHQISCWRYMGGMYEE
jgi:hypothetical protein